MLGDSIQSQAPNPEQTLSHPAYPAQTLNPHDPHNPTYHTTVAAQYNQVHAPQTFDPATSPEEFDESDQDDTTTDGERGLGSMLLGRKKKKKGLLHTVAGMVGSAVLGGSSHHTGYGYGYNGQGANPYGWYGEAGGYGYQSYDMSAFGGLANFDHSQTIQQTMMDNAVLNSQMMANSGSQISNLC